MNERLHGGATGNSTVPPILIDKAAAAVALSVHERSLDDYVKAGIVPIVKLGGRRLFSPDHLREWAIEQSQKSIEFASANSGNSQPSPAEKSA